MRWEKILGDDGLMEHWNSLNSERPAPPSRIALPETKARRGLKSGPLDSRIAGP